MPKITIGYGILLIIIGVGGYFGAQAQHAALDIDKPVSLTALIPAIFGFVAFDLGLLALLVDKARKHAMHGAAVVSLLAIVAPTVRILGAMSKGNFDITKISTIALLSMAVVSAIFLALCVRSFIVARRSRVPEAYQKS